MRKRMRAVYDDARYALASTIAAAQRYTAAIAGAGLLVFERWSVRQLDKAKCTGQAREYTDMHE